MDYIGHPIDGPHGLSETPFEGDVELDLTAAYMVHRREMGLGC